MIRQLTISNYALIDSLDIQFTPGLNIITGETGAGKSIMLSALSMLLGARSDQRVVTDKTRKSVVEAIFDITGYEATLALLADNDIDVTSTELILRREIAPNGRSRAFINDTPVQVTLLREVSVMLVDIHSQHQSLLLSTPQYQLRVIDSLIDDPQVRHRYDEAYSIYRTALRQYHQAKSAVQSIRDDEQYMRYQLSCLDQLNPVEGEDATLEAELHTLSNVEQTKSDLAAMLSTLSDSESDDDIVSRLSSLVRYADGLALPEADDLARRIEALRIEADDIASTLSEIFDRLEDDPARLEYVRTRLADIASLERQHHVDSTDELARIRTDLASRLALIDSDDSTLAELTARAKAAKAHATECATALTEARRAVAERFIDELVKCAAPMGMTALSARVDFTPTQLSATGADAIDMLFSFNRGTEPMPLRDTASGGEISRLMLAVKAIVASHLRLPTILFDEIDTGVSGDIARRMGALMLDIASQTQVIAITHLPQVAAYGTSHFKVYKDATDTSTNTHIRLLSHDERIDEIATMLSGTPDNPHARRIAAEQLNK